MFESLPVKVKIVEVGPRDGLQNEPEQVATTDKAQLIEKIAEAGLGEIEITSFVSPKWIPQLADATELAELVCNKLDSNITTSALVPNLKGYERFKETSIKQVNLFMSASESHSKKNINKSIDEALIALKEVADVAKADGYRVRAYVSVVFECPYEGKISPEPVINICDRLLEMKVDEISLGDTIGAATPVHVAQVIGLLAKNVGLEKLALHFHDTRGGALANVLTGLESGIRIFDSSLGGLGGCPYAPGASGNLATEDLVYMLHGMNVDTGINLDKLVEAGKFAQKVLKKDLPGRFLKAYIGAECKKNEKEKIAK
ncbi:MAG: hydroxymethylglutaryl-CoA lyase [Cyanobacteria bacterium TGS_CYA1]|nr:hydroxymethylglutaryl-CoA lyase [Cyanobacteria bacterium TGS_CYA1]